MISTDLRLSIIVPVSNGERLIKDAINCLLGCMAFNDELIVINDGSSDSTGQILHSLGLFRSNMRCIETGCVGPSGARNAGLSLARGSYISFLDHDDLWPEGRLERHLEYLQNNPDVSVVVGKTNYEFEGAVAGRSVEFRNGSSALHHVHLGAATFRKEVFDTVGLFNESLRFSEDHEFFLRVREQGHLIHFEPEISLRYRIHGNNMSLDKSLHELGVFQILADSIKRRRIRGKIEQLPSFGEATEK